MKHSVILTCLVLLARSAAADDSVLAVLAAEVKGMGWIAFSARTESGDWDLFVMRPDGSGRRALTRSPDASKCLPRFSPDGTQLLYRRLAPGEVLDGNRHGEQGVPVLASSDGSGARDLGGEGDMPWASWGPEGKALATLSIKGVRMIDIATGKVLREIPRQGFYQQMTWSPDGQWLSGVSNAFGTGWSVARMNATTGEINAVSRTDCCTPDWFPDSDRIVFSSRPPGQGTNGGQGWTQLWMADADGGGARLLYAEDGRHIYGGHLSPDGRYVLFTGNPQEDGDPGNGGAPMELMRLADAPIVVVPGTGLKARHPEAKAGPVLTLPSGFEPCWTASEAPAS